MSRSGVYVGLVGNIIDGVTVVGPFDDRGLGFDTLDEQFPHQEIVMTEIDFNFVNRWDNPLVQFARLIDELQAAIPDECYNTIMQSMEVSMDLNTEQIAELFRRAQEIWDSAKAMI